MISQARIEAAEKAFLPNEDINWIGFTWGSEIKAAIEAADNEPEYKAALEVVIEAAKWAAMIPLSSRPSIESMQAAIKILRGEDMIPYYDEREDAWRCRVCDGNGDIPASKSPVIIGPDTEYTNGDRILCPHCDGSGHD